MAYAVRRSQCTNKLATLHINKKELNTSACAAENYESISSLEMDCKTASESAIGTDHIVSVGNKDFYEDISSDEINFELTDLEDYTCQGSAATVDKVIDFDTNINDIIEKVYGKDMNESDD